MLPSMAAVLLIGCILMSSAMSCIRLAEYPGRCSLFRLYGSFGKLGTIWSSMISLPMLATFFNQPLTDWVCLSTDGAVSTATGMGSVGEIFRTDDGSWILGFNKTIGILCPLQAELWGILLGLQPAWDNGFERLIIQSDNREAIRRVSASTASSNPCSLVRSIAALRYRGWATKTQ
ncbi:hypothetical protein V6N11_022526 [Hibiscus sabdariffa]|uniref:RNase H type-1 domain-containing protein n=1 Tax=Hibiscus sabdariffa TaxID=183260 RepID=A0ABR2TJU0_9ROSI